MAADDLPGPHAATPLGKPRARSVGIPMDGTPGRWNAITDVPGVHVGYTTLIEGIGADRRDRDPPPRAARSRRPGGGRVLLPERQRRADRGQLDLRIRQLFRAGGDHQHPPRHPRPGPYRHHGLHFSGDLFLAFSTASPGGITPGVTIFRPRAEGRYDQLRFIPWGYLDPFYAAVVQATEEAVLNALIANDDMTGRAGVLHRVGVRGLDAPRPRLERGTYCLGGTFEVALIAPAVLGLSGAPCHGPCHAGGRQCSMTRNQA